MAHPAGFEPATIRLEGGKGCHFNAANYKGSEKIVNLRDTKVTLLGFPDVDFA